MGFGAAALAALIPAREAARTPVGVTLRQGALIELRPVALGPWSIAGALLLVLAGGAAAVGLQWHQPLWGFVSAGGVLAGFSALTPAATVALNGALEAPAAPPLRRGGTARGPLPDRVSGADRRHRRLTDGRHGDAHRAVGDGEQLPGYRRHLGEPDDQGGPVCRAGGPADLRRGRGAPERGDRDRAPAAGRGGGRHLPRGYDPVPRAPGLARLRPPGSARRAQPPALPARRFARDPAPRAGARTERW